MQAEYRIWQTLAKAEHRNAHIYPCTHTKGIWFLFFAVCLPVTPGNDVGMADTVWIKLINPGEKCWCSTHTQLHWLRKLPSVKTTREGHYLRFTSNKIKCSNTTGGLHQSRWLSDLKMVLSSCKCKLQQGKPGLRFFPSLPDRLLVLRQGVSSGSRFLHGPHYERNAISVCR